MNGVCWILFDRCKKIQVEHLFHLSFYFTTQLVEYKVERLEFYERNAQQHMGSLHFHRLVTLITKNNTINTCNNSNNRNLFNIELRIKMKILNQNVNQIKILCNSSIRKIWIR